MMDQCDNPIVKSTSDRTKSKDGKLRSSVMAALQSHTHFLDSPRIRESLSVSDFDFADLKKGTMSVYLVLPSDRIETFKRWMRLLIQQSLTVNARNVKRQPKQPVLFLLDEMAALGHLSKVSEAYSLMAGFGIQLWGIIQDLSQLESSYGKLWQTFIGNSGALQYFGSRDLRTAEYFSKMCGMQTVEKTSISKTLSEVAGRPDTSTTDNVQRPLMFADEMMVMREEKEVVLVDNYNPIPAHKQPWFKNPRLYSLGHDLRKEGREPLG
jgi:type IV secretion system protein VirD4